MENLQGKIIDDRYQIEEILGRGGMAEVYRAVDIHLNQKVAIKVLRAEREHSEVALKRFALEAKALAQLQHPNIVAVLDSGVFEGMPYLVMDYMPGGTLKNRMGKPVPWQEAAKLLIPIAQALNYTHNHGILHRDVKPTNILLNEDSTPMLSDFGIAKLIEAEETMDLTHTGSPIGTFSYMSPEQGLGKQIDSRTDVYALGVVFYELITGQKPFTGNTTLAVIHAQAQGKFPHPKKFVPDIPDAVMNFMQKTLAPKPEDRHPNMAALATALEKLSLGETKEARKKKMPLMAWIGLGSGVLIIAAILLASNHLFNALRGKSAETNQSPEDSRAVERVSQEVSNPQQEDNSPVSNQPFSQQSPTLAPTNLLATTPTVTNPIIAARTDYLIAFSSDKNGIYQVYTADPDEPDNWSKLANPTGFDRSWWPTFCGSWVLFESNASGNNQWIYSVDTQTNDISAWGPPETTDWLGVPRCSADNRYIAYSTHPDSNHYELRIADENNQAIFRMMHDYSRASNAFISGYVTFSLDSTRFVSIANPSRDSRYEMYVTDNFTTTRYIGDGMYAAISPDGEKVAFNCEGNTNICVSDISGKNITKVVSIKGKSGIPSGTPVWSPDGEWIYYASAADGDFDIYRIQLSVSRIENLTNNTNSNEVTPAVQW